MPNYRPTPPDRLQDDPVKLWKAPVTIPTYPIPAAEKNPMFFGKRVYQGSSGKVYPLPFIDRVSDTPVDHDYLGVWLENDCVRLLMLPEIGGRIHLGQDKTRNDHDFFYRQDVIKPALVGLAGPWISGGVEFNWPQHHRPSTHLPTDVALEEHADGSRTCWLSEHDAMARMKGMVGIRLRPGSSLIEADVRLYNRTPHVHTFHWWANVAARAHEQYQSFFPPDVRYVADHAVRAMTEFPIAKGLYYGVDYSPGTDLSWYRNIPVPTSYMVLGSDFDFFGGYYHAAGAGFVHVANRHIAPGKKQWTWGNHEFGWAWDRELTDANGAYVELMAGVYTNNQPDFTYLAPYETKTFSQYWWPIQGIGCAKNANRDVAVNLEVRDRLARVGLAASRTIHAVLQLSAGDRSLLRIDGDVSPGKPLIHDFELPAGTREVDLRLVVLDEAGRILITHRPHQQPERVEVPPPASEPPPPEKIDHSDELFLTGEHLEQYRHPTRRAEQYWEEALRRDPSDARCNLAMGRQYLKRGLLKDAEAFLRRAVKKLTFRHPNPLDGEAHYQLGLALRFQGRLEEAYAFFYKSTWNYAWRSAAYYAVACIDARQGRLEEALEHAELATQHNLLNNKAQCLRAALLRRLGRTEEARRVAEAVVEKDLLDYYALSELALSAPSPEARIAELLERSRRSPRTLLDIAFDYAEAGFHREGIELLERILPQEGSIYPLVPYTLGWLYTQEGESKKAVEYYRLGERMSPDYAFPAQLEEQIVLEAVIAAVPGAAKALYYLGNLYYDKRRHEDAIDLWERARTLCPDFPTIHRNLGIAYFNIQKDGAKAVESYEAAFRADPGDSRLLFELDQLLKKLGEPFQQRLKRLEKQPELIADRDDLSVEFCSLLNLAERHEESAGILSTRRFHPWEGGEGKVMQEHVRTHLALGNRAMRNGDAELARHHFLLALDSPHNLGEAKHLLAPKADIHYWLGKAEQALGRHEAAGAWFAEAAGEDCEHAEARYWKALAQRELGGEDGVRETLEGLLSYARQRLNTAPRIDYFATSLPQLLVFEEDLEARNQCEGHYLTGLAQLGLGNAEEARAAMERALQLDPSHHGALQFLKHITPLNTQ